MLVNPDDLLIFKLREKAKPLPGAATPPAAAQATRPPETILERAGTAAGPETANREATKAKEPAVKEVAPETQYGGATEGKESAQFPATAGPEAGKEEGINFFSYVAGALFIASAIVFGYLVYPQSLFMIGYASKIGLFAFLASVNYAYGISIINVALVLLSAVSGVLMFARPEKAHRFSGVVSSLVILVVTFEYLNSNSGYLFVAVIIAAFFEIGILTYVSMALSSRAAESEERRAEEMLWPRVETF